MLHVNPQKPLQMKRLYYYIKSLNEVQSVRVQKKKIGGMYYSNPSFTG